MCTSFSFLFFFFVERVNQLNSYFETCTAKIFTPCRYVEPTAQVGADGYVDSHTPNLRLGDGTVRHDYDIAFSASERPGTRL